MRLNLSLLIKTIIFISCLCMTWYFVTDGSDYVRVTRSLKRSLVDIDRDVLLMDVGNVLKLIGLESDFDVGASRLVDKLLRNRVYHQEGCVIRITKYCGKRCHNMLLNLKGDPADWVRFSCDFAKSCVIETRFVGEWNLTRKIMKTTDVLVLVDSLHEGLHLSQLMKARPPGQLWVLYSRESPHHDHEYVPPPGEDNPYNLSMTYASDSDIHFPYCYLQKKPLFNTISPVPPKSKLIAWMASNCHRLSWRRGEFVEELQKYLPIDTFGKCGDFGILTNDESDEILGDYKFYLAFENSECREYITEKIWRTCLLKGIVPIVYGSTREDYERVLPRNSFIHLEDFSNMSEFVRYIYELDRDEEKYNRYFDWRRDKDIVCLSARYFIMFAPDVNLCYLVRKLIHTFVNPETSWQKREPDFKTWWQDRCTNSTLKKEVLGFDVHQPVIKKEKRKRSRTDPTVPTIL